MELKFKCYSMANKDFEETYYTHKRFRGCRQGEPMIVKGHTIQDSERNLGIILDALRQIPGSKIVKRQKGSASVILEEKGKEND